MEEYLKNIKNLSVQQLVNELLSRDYDAVILYGGPKGCETFTK